MSPTLNTSPKSLNAPTPRLRIAGSIDGGTSEVSASVGVSGFGFWV